VVIRKIVSGTSVLDSYIHEFDNPDKLLKYLLTKYDIRVSDIPVKYSFDGSQFPNPIYYEHKKPAFEAAWNRFQQDLKNGAFLDGSLKLIYTSSHE
jgi:hypothetical protein